ncbi:MAG TPA: YidB family protein [Vicinamibacteria bacterium]|nr:YidB family protein [Vicinamibacteria bacterium]
MGFLDDVLKQSGGLGSLAQVVAQNPQVVSAAIALLNPKDPSVGGTGGLGGLVGAFSKAGLGQIMSQWISTGPNPPISPDQLSKVLSSDVLGQFAQKAGVAPANAASLLASVLPGLVDHLTPNGQVPAANDLQASLGGLLAHLSGR